MNLYRKYRPVDFSEILGNKETIESLEKVFGKEEENRPRCFLFTGPTGCGKTTTARICANKIGVGELSLVEVNSSNNRGIDTARQIIDQMRSYPAEGDNWVFIVDECHRATKDWQNAMLKPLEDTPSHVYFFLCTTDPHMLVKALRNRCAEFSFSPLSYKYIMRILKRVSRKEEKEVGEDVLEAIADNCEGSPRKALVFLEKVMDMEADKAMKLIVEGIDEENAEMIDLCRALLGKNKDWDEICKILKDLVDTDVEKIRRAVLGYMSSVLLKGKINDRAAIALDNFVDPFYDSGKAGLILACYRTIFFE